MNDRLVERKLQGKEGKKRRENERIRKRSHAGKYYKRSERKMIHDVKNKKKEKKETKENESKKRKENGRITKYNKKNKLKVGTRKKQDKYLLFK